MSDAAAFQGTFSGWRPVMGRGVVQVVIEIPLEAADAALEALGGMTGLADGAWVGVARLQKPADQ